MYVIRNGARAGSAQPRTLPGLQARRYPRRAINFSTLTRRATAFGKDPSSMFSKLFRLRQKIENLGAPQVVSSEELRRTAEHWQEHDKDFCKHRHWTEIPAVAARIRSKLTGSPQGDLFGYVVRKYFVSS